MKTLKALILLLAVSFVAFVVYLNLPSGPETPTQVQQETVGAQLNKQVTIFSSVATTSTSSDINIAGAKRITLLLTRNNQGAAAASTTFSVTASPDGSTFLAFNKLVDNVTNTNAQNLTRVASKVLNATGTAMVSMDLQHDYLKLFRLTAVRVLDGTSSASAIIEY